MKEALVTLENVSKFYGEALGVNRVTLDLEAGITSLVGPNGAGKTTLMNLITGLLRPTSGSVHVLGVAASDSERLFKRVGYCSQFDAFPKGFSGHDLVYSILRLQGHNFTDADALAWAAIEQAGMTEAAGRKIAGYSKGMRQRIKLAAAMAHRPQVLVLDEPLNGLDPMARAEVIELFRGMAAAGMHVLISSHILHEVDLISDRVVMMSNGYVVAEGDIREVRREMDEHPMQILIRCDRPSIVASAVFNQDSAVEVKIHSDGRGLLVSTRNPDRFYGLLNRIVLDHGVAIEAVAPADEDVHSVYRYLIGEEGPTS